MMTAKQWAIAGLAVGFSTFFSRRVLNDPFALQDIVGTMGVASAGAFLGLAAGGVLGLIFGKNPPPDDEQ